MNLRKTKNDKNSIESEVKFMHEYRKVKFQRNLDCNKLMKHTSIPTSAPMILTSSTTRYKPMVGQTHLFPYLVKFRVDPYSENWPCIPRCTVLSQMVEVYGIPAGGGGRLECVERYPHQPSHGEKPDPTGTQGNL